MLDFKRVFAAAPKKPHNLELKELDTVWSEAAKGGATLWEGHPHPQFARKHFLYLDGRWDYAIQRSLSIAQEWKALEPPSCYDGTITVPFSPEAALSGVSHIVQPDEILWYRRSFPRLSSAFAASAGAFCEGRCSENDFPEEDAAQVEASQDFNVLNPRLILHFEAVDWACAVYVNGVRVGTHAGAYLPFSFDITDIFATEPGQSILEAASEAELCVCVYDPTEEGVQLRGKQRLGRGGIWYTAQSGIWQSVWLELVPALHMGDLQINAIADTGVIELSVEVAGSLCDFDAFVSALPLVAEVFFEGKKEAFAQCKVTGAGSYALSLTVDEPRLWSPEAPCLYDIELRLGSDCISSYTAFRTLSLEADENNFLRVCLNHEPIFLRGLLDQGYWPDGLMTAPSEAAFVYDIEQTRAMGFNMLRKHIKIESDRWYYLCDKMGMLVWQDMVCGGDVPPSLHSSYLPTFFKFMWNKIKDEHPAHFSKLASTSEAFRREWLETCKNSIRYLKNHPCIITWVLFNEAWGQFETKKVLSMVRELDPTRLVDAVSGWYDQRVGDFLSVHNYFRPLEVYRDSAKGARAFVISEFGGITCHLSEHASLSSAYGYETYESVEEFRAAFYKLLSRADALYEKGLAGFVYTQLSDVEEETNGLLTYNRKVNKLLDL